LRAAEAGRSAEAARVAEAAAKQRAKASSTPEPRFTDGASGSPENELASIPDSLFPEPGIPKTKQGKPPAPPQRKAISTLQPLPSSAPTTRLIPNGWTKDKTAPTNTDQRTIDWVNAPRDYRSNNGGR
jgi:hypothetical protein